MQKNHSAQYQKPFTMASSFWH